MRRTSLRATRPHRGTPILPGMLLVALLGACSDGPTQPPEQRAVQVVAVSGDGQGAQLGQKLRKPLVVRVSGANGAGVAGVPVTWTAAGTLSAAASTTDASGRAHAEWTLPVEAGEYTATATVAGLPPVGFVATAANFPRATLVDTLALALEYGSVYDVHTEPDPINYPNLRGQPAGFDVNPILRDLEQVIDPSGYEFVLLYTLHEVPGWINAGTAMRHSAKNIGLWNRFAGLPGRAGWPRLRSLPHMNSLRFLASPEFANDPDFGALTAIHEMGHIWLAYFVEQHEIGPRNWQHGRDPVANLASGPGHWHTSWLDPGLPGLMASKPTSRVFNAFDLYAIGLMGYEEASQYSYRLFEGNGEPPRNPVVHEITLDSLISALRPTENRMEYFEGDGRRIPDTEPEMAEIEVLLVVVKGADERFTDQDRTLVTTLARQISQAWRVATWGRSTMRVVVRPGAGAAP